MKIIGLPDGSRVKLDDDDYSWASKFAWHLSNGYASRHRNDGSGSKLYLHRLVNKTPKDMHTDHINGDKLDNRKANLRTVSSRQNNMNRRKDSRGGLTSTLKGASYHEKSKKWRARIKVGNKQISLGYYKTDREAHLAYRAAAQKYFGIYALPKERI